MEVQHSTCSGSVVKENEGGRGRSVYRRSSLVTRCRKRTGGARKASSMLGPTGSRRPWARGRQVRNNNNDNYSISPVRFYLAVALVGSLL